MLYVVSCGDDCSWKEIKLRKKIEESEEKRRLVGVVKWFSLELGYGFITREDTGEEVFVHQTDVAGNNPEKAVPSLDEGEMVEFDLAMARKGHKAVKVTGPKGAPVKGSAFAPNKMVRNSNSRERVERISPWGWEKANARMLASIDMQVYDGFVQEQVKLLGGCQRFYEDVAASLGSGRRPFIREEQKALYMWRNDFFHDKFQCIYFGNPRPSDGGALKTSFYWATEGNDDAHCLDTLPYQVHPLLFSA